MKIAIFVLADILVPLMLGIGEQLTQKHGHSVRYLNFLPRDHKLLSKNTDALYPKNLNTLDGTSQAPDMLFSKDAVAEMVAFMQTKHGGDMHEWHQRVNAVARYIRHFIASEKPNAFVLWNGQDHIGRVISAFSKEKDIPVIYMENGYFSQTLQLDRQGVNASSRLANMAFDDIVALANAQASEVIDETAPAQSQNIQQLTTLESFLVAASHYINPSYYATYPEQRGSSRFKNWRINRFRNSIPNDTLELPPEFAFIPFQVHDDTQVLLNSKLVKSVDEFFKLSHAAIRRVCGKNFPIIVKEHPEDIGRHDYSELKQQYPDVIWLRKFNIETLLDKATIVMVINSSVGLQAIQRKKPTIVLGESFYTKPEICFVAKDISQLDNLVEQAMLGTKSCMQNNIDIYISALHKLLFCKGSWKMSLAAAIPAAKRINNILLQKFARKNQRES